MEFVEQFRGWLSVIISASAVLFAVLSARGRATKEAQTAQDNRIEALEKKRESDGHVSQVALEQLRARVQRCEDAIEHAPSKDQLHEMRILVERMDGQIGRIAEGLKPLAASVGRIDDFLMGQGQQRRDGGR